MDRRLTVLTLIVAAIFPVSPGFSAEMPKENLLWDGFVLTGVEGQLIPGPSNHKNKEESDADSPFGLEWSRSGWFFEFAEDVNDLRAKAPAGTKLELLPSSTLEKLIADANERSENTYSISGWVTKYRRENLIFPTSFLPVGKIAERPQMTHAEKQKSQSNTEKKTDQPPVSEPDDELTMPKEITERLETSRIVRPDASAQTPNIEKTRLKRDNMLIYRSAFLVERDYGLPDIVLDALGRNVRPVRIQPLPSEALELAQLTQSLAPEPVRFKISGIVTTYKGEKFLLLQKATRVYSHGNFAR
jgi:hypothetical protein